MQQRPPNTMILTETSALAIRALCFLFLMPNVITFAASTQTAHLRSLTLRSDVGATDLEGVMATLTQRLDSLEAGNQALRGELQTAKIRNENLKAVVQQVRDHLLQTLQLTTPSQTTATSAPPGTELLSTTARPAKDYSVLLPTLQSHVGQLRANVSGNNVKMASLAQRSRGLQRDLDVADVDLDHKMAATRMKYSMVAEIVRGIQTQTRVSEQNLISLMSQSNGFMQRANSLARAEDTFNQTSVQYIDDVHRAMQLLLTRSTGAKGASFQATAGASESRFPSGASLVFPSVVMNQGDLYDQSTGQVRTILAGWYIFLVQVGVRTTDNADAQISLVKNDQAVASVSAVDVDKRSLFFTLHALVHLSIHDRVWVSLSVPHSDPHHPDYLMPLHAATFMGMLVTG